MQVKNHSKQLKDKNSKLHSKALQVLILICLSTASLFAQIPTNFPTTLPPGFQIPGMNGGNNAGKNANAIPQNTGDRNVEMTAEELAELERQDSIRALQDEELLLERNLRIKREKIFGYKLFNGYTPDPNLVLNIPTPNNYVLGTNDQLIVDIYGFSQERQEVTVDKDGYINLTRAGLIKVSGLTLEEATQQIRSAMGKIYLGLSQGNTKLKVSLGAVRSIKITITGEVATPGTYTMSSLNTVFNAMYSSGGPTEYGSYRDIKVVRNNKVVATLDLYDILIHGYSDDNILLQDQDIIQVPPYINRVTTYGELKRVGYFETKEKESLEDLIKFSGGFAPMAYTHKVRIYRSNGREMEIADVDTKNFSNFAMQAGDSLFVGKVLERYANLVNVAGAVYRPGDYALSTNNTLKQLIESSEGFLPQALIGRISILRTRDNLTTNNISINYEDLLSGKIEDIPLQREDKIFVPSTADLVEASTIKISGAINNPGTETEDGMVEGIEIPYSANLTLEDVLVKVGGLKESASLSRVEIVRRKKNVDIGNSNAQISEIINVNVNQDLKVVSGQKNVTLEPFDEIFVRNSPNYEKQTFVQLEGEVFYPSTYGIQSKEERISHVIERAGGLTLQAFVPGATLIRTVVLTQRELEQKQKTIEELTDETLLPGDVTTEKIDIEEVEETRQESIGIDLEYILKHPGSAEDLILKDGDLIRIPKKLETVRVQGEVLYPTTVKYLRGNTFKSYISGSGGFTSKSFKSKTYVLYPNGSVDRTRKFLVFNIYPKVQPGSEIIVPKRVQNTTTQVAQFASLIGIVGSTLTTIMYVYGLIRINGR